MCIRDSFQNLLRPSLTFHNPASPATRHPLTKTKTCLLHYSSRHSFKPICVLQQHSLHSSLLLSHNSRLSTRLSSLLSVRAFRHEFIHDHDSFTYLNKYAVLCNLPDITHEPCHQNFLDYSTIFLKVLFNIISSRYASPWHFIVTLRYCCLLYTSRCV